ncbi:MAG TPA: ATP-dependent DNA helicase RecG, partial [Treponemataceae bacterium]|nr:ATP-dependent DNA helicase RecG [Treponemataceae bacterium]
MYAGEIPIPVSRLKGVGPQTAKVLSNLDILTVGDLLSWWPRDWEDRTVSTPLSRFAERKKIHTIARVASHDWFGAGRMKTLKLIIEDDEGTLAELICFNRPFLEKQFPVDSRVSVYGSFRIAYGSIQSSAFEIDLDSQFSRKVFPVYPLTASLTQIQMRKIISSALDSYAKGIDSELPQEVRSAHGIPAKHEILHMMHRPHRVEEATTAKEALIFEELYLFELAIG